MKKRGLAQRLAAACGALALGVACLVASPTTAQAVTYTTADGVTVEASEYKCANGHTGTVNDVVLMDCSWSGNELTFKVWVRYQCPECGISEQRRSIERKVTVTCRGGETTLERWHGNAAADSIAFTFSVASGHHTLEHFEAKDATCENEGNVEYWECSKCHKLFLDAAGTREASPDDVFTPYAHRMHFVEGKLATCTEDGWIEHYECEKCGGTFLDDAGYCPWGVLRPKGHTLVGVDAKAPTCTEAGNIAYNECNVCHKKFADEQCKQELSDADVTLAPAGHTFENGVCTACGAKQPAAVDDGGKPSGEGEGERPASDAAGKLPAATTKQPVAAKPAAATKLGAAKLLPQTGEEVVPVALLLAAGAGVAILGIRRRHSND